MAEGPWFEDFEPGQVFSAAPGLTLSTGRASTHQAIVGDRLALALDDELARAVTGRAPLAHPALVWDVAIGQSTVATHHVRANLFYRGLRFHRLPAIGDTLRTRTEVVGLRQNRARPDRAATGLVALRITTCDQRGDLVLDFVRCAMIPLRDPTADTGHADDLDEVPRPPPVGPGEVGGLGRLVQDWDLDAFSDYVGDTSPRLEKGQTWEIGGGDVVSSAPELARLTLNVAKVHHDAAQGGERLVYGGHTIGLALSQAGRALPRLVTVVGWHSCDHVGPVREGDTLRSRLTVEAVEPVPGGSLVQLHSQVTGSDDRDVLDWRFLAIAV
ncbi:MAG TPA: MaoC family dehydratase [Jatrophihabitantaceae bacterium]